MVAIGLSRSVIRLQLFLNCRHVETISQLCQSAKEEGPTVPAQKRHPQYELVSCTHKWCLDL